MQHTAFSDVFSAYETLFSHEAKAAILVHADLQPWLEGLPSTELEIVSDRGSDPIEGQLTSTWTHINTAVFGSNLRFAPGKASGGIEQNQILNLQDGAINFSADVAIGASNAYQLLVLGNARVRVWHRSPGNYVMEHVELNADGTTRKMYTENFVGDASGLGTLSINYDGATITTGFFQTNNTAHTMSYSMQGAADGVIRPLTWQTTNASVARITLEQRQTVRSTPAERLDDWLGTPEALAMESQFTGTPASAEPLASRVETGIVDVDGVKVLADTFSQTPGVKTELYLIEHESPEGVTGETAKARLVDQDNSVLANAWSKLIGQGVSTGNVLFDSADAEELFQTARSQYGHQVLIQQEGILMPNPGRHSENHLDIPLDSSQPFNLQLELHGNEIGGFSNTFTFHAGANRTVVTFNSQGHGNKNVIVYVTQYEHGRGSRVFETTIGKSNSATKVKLQHQGDHFRIIVDDWTSEEITWQGQKFTKLHIYVGQPNTNLGRTTITTTEVLGQNTAVTSKEGHMGLTDWLNSANGTAFLRELKSSLHDFSPTAIRPEIFVTGINGNELTVFATTSLPRALMRISGEGVLGQANEASRANFTTAKLVSLGYNPNVRDGLGSDRQLELVDPDTNEVLASIPLSLAASNTTLEGGNRFRVDSEHVISSREIQEIADELLYLAMLGPELTYDDFVAFVLEVQRFEDSALETLDTLSMNLDGRDLRIGSITYDHQRDLIKIAPVFAALSNYVDDRINANPIAFPEDIEQAARDRYAARPQFSISSHRNSILRTQQDLRDRWRDDVADYERELGPLMQAAEDLYHALKSGDPSAQDKLDALDRAIQLRLDNLLGVGRPTATQLVIAVRDYYNTAAFSLNHAHWTNYINLGQTSSAPKAESQPDWSPPAPITTQQQLGSVTPNEETTLDRSSERLNRLIGQTIASSNDPRIRALRELGGVDTADEQTKLQFGQAIATALAETELPTLEDFVVANTKLEFGQRLVEALAETQWPSLVTSVRVIDSFTTLEGEAQEMAQISVSNTKARALMRQRLIALENVKVQINLIHDEMALEVSDAFAGFQSTETVIDAAYGLVKFGKSWQKLFNNGRIMQLGTDPAVTEWSQLSVFREIVSAPIEYSFSVTVEQFPVTERRLVANTYSWWIYITSPSTVGDIVYRIETGGQSIDSLFDEQLALIEGSRLHYINRVQLEVSAINGILDTLPE